MKSCQLWITLVATLIVGVISLTNSPQFGQITAYTLDEPHVMGPTWEAAARNELFIRCSDNYAAPVSSCTAYSGLIDSFFVRAASFITGHHPIITDPEFVDPLLQWLLVVKNGIFFLGAVGVALVLLSGTFGSPLCFGLVFIAFFSKPDTIANSFEVSANGELGAALLLLFCLFLHNEITGRKLGTAGSLLAGALGTVKLPSLFFLLPVLNSVRAFVFGMGMFALLTLGLLRNSFELSTPFQILGTYSVPVNQSSHPLSLFGRIALNFHWIAGDYWFLLPLALLGVIIFSLPLLKQCRLLGLARLGWIGAITSLAIISRNSQARYFVGFSGIYFTCVGVGLAFVAREAVKRWGEKRITAILAMAFCISAICSLAHFGPASTGKISTIADVLIRKKTSPDVTPNDRLLAELANSGETIFLDWRVRSNLDAAPLLGLKGKFHVVDALNSADELPAKGKLVTVCYDEHSPNIESVASLGNLGQAISAQCGSDRLNLRQLTRFQNDRRDAGTGKLVVYDLSKPLNVSPMVVRTHARVVVPASQFDTRGAYVQEWDSVLTNVNLGRAKAGFSLRKKFRFEPGRFHLSVPAASNYRSDDSALEIFLGQNKIGACALNTSDQLFAKDRFAHFAGKLVAKWRNKYFPIHCDINFQFQKTTVEQIRIELKTREDEGSVRFQTVDLWTSEN